MSSRAAAGVGITAAAPRAWIASAGAPFDRRLVTDVVVPVVLGGLRRIVRILVLGRLLLIGLFLLVRPSGHGLTLGRLVGAPRPLVTARLRGVDGCVVVLALLRHSELLSLRATA